MKQKLITSYTLSILKDNEAERRRHRRRIFIYAEEADNDANKVSHRKQEGTIASVYVSDKI
jgi:hypothetical protein